MFQAITDLPAAVWTQWTNVDTQGKCALTETGVCARTTANLADGAMSDKYAGQPSPTQVADCTRAAICRHTPYRKAITGAEERCLPLRVVLAVHVAQPPARLGERNVRRKVAENVLPDVEQRRVGKGQQREHDRATGDQTAAKSRSESGRRGADKQRRKYG